MASTEIQSLLFGSALHFLSAMPDIWIQELDVDSTTQEWDRENTNKDKNYVEELTK